MLFLTNVQSYYFFFIMSHLYCQQIKRLFYDVLSEVCVHKDRRTQYGKACLFASQSCQKPNEQQNTFLCRGIYIVTSHLRETIRQTLLKNMNANCIEIC